MENALVETFVHEQFGKVRVVILDGKPRFVGVDAAKALDYADPRSAVRKNVDDEDKMVIDWNMVPQGRPNSDATSSKGWIKNEVIVINESGLFALILRSRLKRARDFKHWVTSVLFPALFSKGYYAMNDAADKMAALESANAALKEENAALKAQLAEAEKKALKAALALEELDTTVPDTEAMLKCVYVLEMNSDLVKIGQTNNVQRRIKSISSSSGFKILKHYETDFVDSKNAREIEKACHEAFADRRTSGEFFDITFEEACEELNKYADQIAEAHKKIVEFLAMRKKNMASDDFTPFEEKLFECARMATAPDLRDTFLRKIADMLDA